MIKISSCSIPRSSKSARVVGKNAALGPRFDAREGTRSSTKDMPPSSTPPHPTPHRACDRTRLRPAPRVCNFACHTRGAVTSLAACRTRGVQLRLPHPGCGYPGCGHFACHTRGAVTLCGNLLSRKRRNRAALGRRSRQPDLVTNGELVVDASCSATQGEPAPRSSSGVLAFGGSGTFREPFSGSNTPSFALARRRAARAEPSRAERCVAGLGAPTLSIESGQRRGDQSAVPKTSRRRAMSGSST